MARSLKKGPFIESPSMNSSTINIWSRRSWIFPHWVGSNLSIYTGKTFLSLKIKEEMVGHRFGEFASTRRKVLHKKKKKRK